MGAVRTELWCRVAGPWSGVGRHRGACEQHNRQRRGGERGVQRRGKAGGGQLDHVPVGEPLLAADRDGPATQLAHRRGRGLQDEIYASRRVVAVPDWFYRVTRERRQRNMQDAAREQAQRLPAALR